MEGKLRKAASTVDNIMTMGEVQPHMTLVLLGLCANTMLDFAAGLIDHEACAAQVAGFDALLSKARGDLILPLGAQALDDQEHNIARADTIASLPGSMGGLGHTRLADKGPVMAMVTVMRCAMLDPRIKDQRQNLEHILRPSPL
jgi:hypothetical protein